jgi:GDP-mannose 6-dehydrogenase
MRDAQSISVFGLGYVGTVTAAVLASRGNCVIGVDPNPRKVERIRAGISPVVETGLQELLTEASRSGHLWATENATEAVALTDISFISVGTPSQENGEPVLEHVREVAGQTGKALKEKGSFHWVVVRSTVLPGTTQSVIVPILESASGKKNGRDFSVCFNPEFLREGTAVSDFCNPPFTIIGTEEPKLTSPIRSLYSHLAAPLYETQTAVAEMVKYSSNAFHALKVAFANEVGTICNALGITPATVLDVFKADTRLNTSSAYLTPGFAFGGSCLTKDLRALAHRTTELNLKLPLLESILPSNLEHIERAAGTILSLLKRRIGVLGLSFKAGTDDLRESAMVLLVEKLISKGCDIRIWDKNVSLGRMIGSNRQFIEDYIPHVGRLLEETMDKVLLHAEVVVIGSNAISREEILSRLGRGKYVVDISRLEQPILSEAVPATPAMAA